MIGIVGKGNFSKLIQEEFSKRKVEYVLYDYQDNKDQLNKVLNCEYIILALPIQYIEDFLSNINNQIIIDVCSVKEYPKELYLKNKIKAILTHPMFGPNSVKEHGLKNQKIMLSFDLVDEKEKSKFLNFLKRFNLNAIEMSCSDHDKITSKTLVLHHIIGRIIPLLKKEELDTSNYNKLLDIYNSVVSDSDDLFNSLIKYNKYSKEELSLMRDKIDKLISNI